LSADVCVEVISGISPASASMREPSSHTFDVLLNYTLSTPVSSTVNKDDLFTTSHSLVVTHSNQSTTIVTQLASNASTVKDAVFSDDAIGSKASDYSLPSTPSRSFVAEILPTALGDETATTMATTKSIDSLFTYIVRDASSTSVFHSVTVPSAGDASTVENTTFERFLGAPLWLIALVIVLCLSAIFAFLFVIVFCLLQAKSGHKLCWTKHRYHTVPLFYLNQRNKAAATIGNKSPSGELEMHVRV
jgi:hypothetical protein